MLLIRGGLLGSPRAPHPHPAGHRDVQRGQKLPTLGRCFSSILPHARPARGDGQCKNSPASSLNSKHPSQGDRSQGDPSAAVPPRAVPKHSLSSQWRCPGASDGGSSSNQAWEHHHCKADADMGSSGAAVISFQEQITFLAAKDMLGLNKNGNSQQIELEQGAVVTSSLKTLPVPAGSMVVSEEAEGCAKGCSSGRKAGGWGTAATPQLLTSSRIRPRLLARPFPALALARAAQPRKPELFVCSFLGEKSR